MHLKQKLQRQHEQLLAHRWLSNPLDWAQIDRLILLSGMVMLVPLFFGSSIILVLAYAPQWLQRGVAEKLLLFFSLYLISMVALVLMAFRRRKTHATWPFFEDYIIYSYVAVVFVQSWLSGTHLTGGMLLLMIGAYLTSALADIRKVMHAFVLAVIGFVALAVVEGSGVFRYAPVFARPPYNADGSPVFGWFAIQIMQIAALLMITYVGMIATRRWVERENLFREMSTIDGLTRLTNRRSFIERSESEFERARRADLKGISCIMIDIDHFKRINDTLGHPAGDAVLVQTAGLLLDSARPYDEVGRYGGEEFAVLLPETTLEVATMVAERLRQKIADHEIVVGRKKVRVTASFGVACFPGDGIETINDLLKAADKALYEAKYGGRNRVVASRKKPKAGTRATKSKSPARQAGRKPATRR